jgi:hypothetical protein
MIEQKSKISIAISPVRAPDGRDMATTRVAMIIRNDAKKLALMILPLRSEDVSLWAGPMQ